MYVVVFDIGGVLVRIAHTWQQAAAVAGIRLSVPDKPDIYLEDLPVFREYQVGAIDESRYLPALARDLGIDPTMALAVHDGILIEPFPGTSELVDDLERLGIDTGVLSNTNRPHWEVLDDAAHYPAIARIHRKMPSHEVGVQKPDPGIFLLFCETFGCDPHEVVYFDDNARNVAAASSLGWHSTLVDPHDDPVAQMRKVLMRLGALR